MAGPERVRKPIASNLQSTIRDLQRRKARGRRGLALIEGVRLVEEALAAGLTFRGALVAPDLARTTRGRELVVELERHAVAVEEGSARALGQVADTEAPQGIVAVVEPRTWAPGDIALGGERTAALVIDGVQDPGNVGTLIRTAHAMGAAFRHPVVPFDDAAFIAWARQHDVTLWATAADGEPLPRAVRAGGSGPIAVIVGNEGAGIRPQLNAVSAKRVAIPLAQGAESLNVAVAAGILLFEVTR